MQIFKKVNVDNKWFIKVLVHNNTIWSPHQWKYRFFKDTGYPTSKIVHATQFETEVAVNAKIVELMELMDTEIPPGYGPRKPVGTVIKSGK